MTKLLHLGIKKKQVSFVLLSIFVSLASLKILAFENKKKNELFFCTLLIKSYLCPHRKP